ncbi:unnamed protein product [Anisakis simplex]|uniref:Beta-lactamase domain-containing protein n=1 Tax=Anisakis simplex TaxID=6269 RepID=A0A0M3K7A9_ANISI|nr:unnamed protein product [Anisakis simplex]
MLTAAVCAGAGGFAWYSNRAKSSKTIAIDDHCNQSSSRLNKGSIRTDLEPIRQIFEDILKNEQQGLALAVYHNDELVVDLYGGYADR